MVGTIIAALASAFITGALARFAVPGPDPMPAWLTVLIGLGGTVVGGGIVILTVGQNPGAVGIASFAASIALVSPIGASSRSARSWGPDAYRFPKQGLRRRPVPRAAPARRHRPRSGDVAVRPAARRTRRAPAAARGATAAEGGGEPTENPAHYLRLIEELHDNGVLDDAEYDVVAAASARASPDARIES